jgi:hypothetical protein
MRFTRQKVLPGAEEPAIPKGVALVDAAQQVVREFLAEATGELWKDDLDTIDVVYVSNGQASERGWSEPEPGVRMTWHQGANRFGLLISINRLAEESGDLGGVPFFLRVAIREPHGPTADGSRLWFLHLPSGTY